MGLIYSDIPELIGSDTEISLRNLLELEDRLNRIVEERIAHLDELAHAIVKEGEDADIVKSIILSLKPESYSDSDGICEANKKSISSMYSALSLCERLLMCRSICSCYLSGEKIGYEMFLDENEDCAVSKTAQERIAYLKNSYNDDAYIHLSTLLPSPRAAYFDSISAVCESVYNNTCEYCILPLETSSDGKLSGFYDTILKYGFKICAVYDLHNQDTKKYTRYGLISKSNNACKTLIRHKSRIKYLEFVFDSDGYPSVSDILLAAEHCSMKLRRIDTLSPASSRTQKTPLICPVFRVESADLNTFLTFLSIDCPGFKSLGIYTQI